MSSPHAQEQTGSATTPRPNNVGIVVQSTGSWYEVRVKDRSIFARARGRFRLDDTGTTNPIVVGDYVTVRMNEDETGVITEIHPRRNKLGRRAAGRRIGMEHIIAANIDAAWIVQSIRMPKLNPGFIDRFLVMAELNEIPTGLIFNKVDLMKAADQDAIAFWRDLYTGLGYPVLTTSALTGEGIEEFALRLQDRTSVVTGPSGTGKSSILNIVDTSLELRTNEVSAKTRKGKHTTTTAVLYPLHPSGFVVDTPGLREFGIIDLDPANLSHYFVEFRPFLHDCRFPNCTHNHEPDCAVKAAVEEDLVTEERYSSYLNILYSLNLGDKDVGR